MLDDILDMIGGNAERGLRALLYLIAIAFLFPVLGILAQIGYGGWGIGHLGAAVAIALLTNGAIRRNPGHRDWLLVILIAGTTVMLLGAAGALGEWKIVGMTPRANPKAAGMTLALVISMVAMFVVGIAFSGAALVYPALIPDSTIAGAGERTAGKVIKGFLGGSAWVWSAGLFVLAFGPNISWEIGTLCLFTAMIIILGAWGWDLGGGIGKVIAFYSATGLFFIVTGSLIAAVAEEFNFWETFWGRTLEPFAIAIVPILLWQGFRWLRFPVLLRFGMASISMLLIVRALLVQVPSVAWGATVGYDVRPYLHVSAREDPMYAGVLDILTSTERYTRDQKLRNLFDEITHALSASRTLSDVQIADWQKALAAIQKDYGREPTLQRAKERAKSLPADVRCWLFRESKGCK